MIVRNKKADLEYNFEYEIEAGLVLKPDEVKSIRLSSPSIKEAYGTVIKREVFIRNLNLSRAKDSNRSKKLLLHRKQINKIIGLLSINHSNIIIIREFYDKAGIFKVLIGIGQKLKLYDKREKIKQKEMKHTQNYV